MILKVFSLSDGSRITIPYPNSYKDCYYLAQSDFYRIEGRRLSVLEIVCHVLNPSKCSILFWYRFSQYKGFFYPIIRIIYAISKRVRNVQLPSSVLAGYGLYLGHSICMVINEGTIIGNNVNLSQFLNIGTNNNTPSIIGDFVYVGPSVCIVEDVNVCSYSTVGAGAVVVHDVRAGSTVVGVPAKEVHQNNPGRFIKNPFPIQLIHP